MTMLSAAMERMIVSPEQQRQRHKKWNSLREPPKAPKLEPSPIITAPIAPVPLIETLAVSLTPEFEVVPEPVRFKRILRVVCARYEVSEHDILSRRRTAKLVRPRQVIYYLAKTLTLESLPAIGRRLGGRDHTSVLHGIRKMERLRAVDDGLASLIEAFETQLRPQPIPETEHA